MLKKKNQNLGFTVIELLFVILLIGILVLISVNLLNTSRQKARDAKRLADIRRIRTALEFYNLEYSTYPQVDQPLELGSENATKLCDQESGGFVPTEVTCQHVFMAPIPQDPKTNWKYLYVGNQDGYTIAFTTERETSLGAPGSYFAHSQTINQSPEIK